MIVDYSVARPSPDQLVGLGAIGAMRYLGTDSRCITAAERDQLHGAGLGVGLIAEGDTQTYHPPLDGLPKGRDHGQLYNALADQLGAPADQPIFYTVDFEPSDTQLRGPVADYFRGVQSVGGRPMRPYGCDRVLDVICGDLGLAPCGWQALAWSYGRRSVHACMFQGGSALGGAVDTNDVLMPADAWLWHPDRPITPVPLEDITMTHPIDVDGAVFEVVRDGNGVKRRDNLSGPALQVALASGRLEQPVVEITDQAWKDEIMSYPLVSSTPSEVGQFALAGNLAARLEAATAKVIAAIPGAPPAPQLDVAVLAKDIIAELAKDFAAMAPPAG